MIDSAAVKREFGSLENNKEQGDHEDDNNSLAENLKSSIGTNNFNNNNNEDADEKDIVTDNTTTTTTINPTTTVDDLPDSSRPSLSTTTTVSPNNDKSNSTPSSGINNAAANHSYEEKIVTKVEYDEDNFLDNESSSNDYQSEYDGYSYGAHERSKREDSSNEHNDHHHHHNHLNRHNDFTSNDHQQQQHQQLQHHNHHLHHHHEVKLNNDNQSDSTLAHSDEPEQLRKLFIGGLDYKTSEATLKKHFERFGDVMDCVVMREPQSKRSRGFGFVIYASSYMVDKAQEARPHLIDGREVQSKRAISREDSGKPEAQATVKKVYLGGLSDDIEKSELENYFKMFGNILNINIVAHKDTGKRRGFAFVEYDDYDPVDKIVLKKFHTIKDKRIEAKKAIPKIEMDARKRGGADPRAVLSLTGAAALDSIPSGPGPGLRQRAGGRGGNGNGCGGYLWDRVPYGAGDYPANLDGYPSHYHYNSSWIMEGGGPPSGSSYGPSRGAYSRNAYNNHVPSWISAADYVGAGGFPPSQGGGGGPMRLSYQHPRYGPYGSGFGGNSAHRGRGHNL